MSHLTSSQIAELRIHAQACEIVRAHGRGEQVDPTALAAAREIVEQAAAPLSDDEQQHRDAMFQLVAEAQRLHQIVFPRDER